MSDSSSNSSDEDNFYRIQEEQQVNNYSMMSPRTRTLSIVESAIEQVQEDSPPSSPLKRRQTQALEASSPPSRQSSSVESLYGGLKDELQEILQAIMNEMNAARSDLGYMSTGLEDLAKRISHLEQVRQQAAIQSKNQQQEQLIQQLESHVQHLEQALHTLKSTYAQETALMQTELQQKKNKVEKLQAKKARKEQEKGAQQSRRAAHLKSKLRQLEAQASRKAGSTPRKSGGIRSDDRPSLPSSQQEKEEETVASVLKSSRKETSTKQQRQQATSHQKTAQWPTAASATWSDYLQVAEQQEKDLPFELFDMKEAGTSTSSIALEDLLAVVPEQESHNHLNIHASRQTALQVGYGM